MLSVKLMRCLRDWSLDISWRLTRAGPATRLRGCDLSGLHVRPLGRRRFFPAALTTTTTTRRLTSLLTDCCCCYRSVRPMRGTRRMEGEGVASDWEGLSGWLITTRLGSHVSAMDSQSHGRDLLFLDSLSNRRYFPALSDTHLKLTFYRLILCDKQQWRITL